jgi:hypothetical protein
MRFYSFDDIRAAGNCAEFATSIYNATIHGGRCAATWRQGDNPDSVSIDREKWYDHVRKEGGGIIELAAHKFGGDIQQAQEFLGEYYRLTPKTQTGAQPKECRYDDLLRQGFREVARYHYRDLDGNIIHFVARLEHPTQKKQFCQGTPKGWGLRDTVLIPYNLAAITASPWCCIVEGEKSADCLIERDIPATTICGGAKKWDSAYAETFRGKSVAIMPDNDEPGREHTQIIASALSGIAADIRIVPTSDAPKGDIYNYIIDEGHSIEDVYSLIQAAPIYTPAAELLTLSADHGPTPAMLAEAKSANSIPFRNFIPSEVEAPARGGKTKKEIVQEPRTHHAMLDDLSKRFLGFPRKQGDKYLFDHDRDSGEIIPIRDADHLLAWIGRRSKHAVSWGRGDAMATARQFHASVEATAHRYESISLIPSWPRRSDVYYAHDQLPAPCPTGSRFSTLLDFFCPSTPIDRHLLAAFICAPLWYIPGIARPAWVIDSADGQGCGKTTLVELVAQLYGHAPICTSKQELSTNLQQIVKRCVSHTGRRARIFLVDNVTGDFKSEELASLITSKDITGMAPYGHGEETRPNDLTYVVTANTATVDADLAHRLFYIMVSRPEMTMDRASWKTIILNYIQRHRLEIVSDIVAMLTQHKPFPVAPATRFPEFETSILQPCCGSAEATQETLEHILKARAESNIDEEQARAIIDVFQFNLSKMNLQNSPCFIKTNLANSWGRMALKESHDYKGFPVQLMRNLAKIGMIPNLSPGVKRWPTSSTKERWSGLAWNFSDTTEQAYVIDKKENEEPSFVKV